MSQNQQYREQIDACRPGSDDLSLPALAGLAEAAEKDRTVAAELARSQRFDHAVSAAMHDVPLPVGLLERLEARLAAGDGIDQDEPSLLSEVVENTVSSSQIAPDAAVVDRSIRADSTPSRSRTTRRTWLLIGGLAASTALAGMIAIANLPRSPRNVSRNELAPLAMEWSNVVTSSDEDWTEAAGGALPAGFPIDSAVRGQVTRWKAFRTARGDRGVAYELRSARQPKAVLLVLNSPDNYAVAGLPFTVLPGSSQGKALGAWQRAARAGKLLYVLVVAGDEKALDNYVRKPQTA